MIKEESIAVSLKATYCTLNELTEETDRIWLVFHGYGQLARYFIKKFEILDPKKHFIVAPQGLSKFYLSGHDGRVGASWMTREERLTEIENQFSYIQTIIDTIPDFHKKKLTYLGFSQGVATMGRFAGWAKIPFEKMVIWAGTFPPDVPEGAYDFLQGSEQVAYFTSREDPYFKEEMIAQQNEIVQKTLNLTPSLNWYEGGHKIIPEYLKKI